MEAYELAERLQQERAREANVPTFRYIAELLDRAMPIWNKMLERKFNENEHGHLRFKSFDYSSRREDDDWLDDIRVIFVDPQGQKHELGLIDRVPGDTPNSDEGYATIEGGGVTRSITPEDEEWDVIVGSIERAIIECSG